MGLDVLSEPLMRDIMKCIICGKTPKKEAYYNIGNMTVTICEEHIDELVVFPGEARDIYSKPGKIIQKNV